MMANDPEIFMQTPLAIWVRTFYDDDGKPLDFKQLCDGVFLHNVWLQIDSQPTFAGVTNPATDLTARLRNLNNLVHNIKAFYEEVLEQVLVMHLPNIITIAKAVYDECSEQELGRLLLLMLGCAVQCSAKGRFIEAIRRLDLATQAELAQNIASLTDNPEAVWTRDWGHLDALPEPDRPRLYAALVQHVTALTKQRDAAAQRLVNLVLEQEGGQPSVCVQHEDAHLGVELADSRGRVRRLQQELEEKIESLSEQKEELDNMKDAIVRLRQQNLELVQDARMAKAYRDEIDILKEKVLKLDRLEAEIHRYKDKMNELEFFRTRVEELREDKRILGETKAMLEEQLESCRRRAEQALQLESELLRARARISECALERDLEREQVQKLLEQQQHLQLEQKAALEEATHLRAELHQLRARDNANLSRTEDSLLEQLNSDAESRALQLELENQRLKQQLREESQQEQFAHTTEELLTKLSTAEGEVKRLTSERAQLSAERSASALQLADMESQCTRLRKRVAGLQEQLELSKADSAKIEHLEASIASSSLENQRLQRSLESAQGRLKECESELQASETQCSKLELNVESLRGQLRTMHDLETENADLENNLHQVEQQRRGLEKDVMRLRTTLEGKDTKLDELTSRVATLEREKQQMQKELDSSTGTAARARELEERNEQLTQQTALDARALSHLRQELVEEKIKSQQLATELERIASSLELTTSLWKSEREKSREAPVNKASLQSVEKAALEEVENLLVVANEEKRSKADREAPTTKSGELIECAADSHQSCTDADKLIPRKIFELRDHIVQLEKKNCQLEEEACCARDQLQALQEHTAVLQGRATSSEQQRLALQAQHAQLQVEAACLASQHAALSQSASQLRDRLTQLDTQKDQLISEKEELARSNESLLRDHQVLEKLHDQLSADYEALASNLSCVKASCKLLKHDNAALKDQLQEVALSQEMLKLREESEDESYRTENAKLKNELRLEREAKEQAQAEVQSLRGQQGSLKEAQAALRLQVGHLRNELDETKGELLQTQDENARLNAQHQVMLQAITSLEEERSQVLSKVSSLLSQYQQGMSMSQLDRETLLQLQLQKEDLEKFLQKYTRRLERSYNLLGSNLKRSKSENLFADVSQTGALLSSSLVGGLSNGEPCQRNFAGRTSVRSHNGHSWAGPDSEAADDQIPVRDVGPLSSPVSSRASPDASLSQRTASPLCFSPLPVFSASTQCSTPSPPQPTQMTVENHTTVNVVTHLTNVAAAPSSAPVGRCSPTATTSRFSRAPTARHSMYSRLRGNSLLPNNSPGLRAPLRLCASQEKLLLDDTTAPDSESTTSTVLPTEGRERRASAVWYEYGCV
ncbi:girdin-like [Ornithodoros turicata]|uniref:girdin-like n=1 Tax=Ornithodoros turicata TaxID=34597 RepID=UPI0031398FF1